MNFSSEQVHWIYGALISIVSVALIVINVRPYSSTRAQQLIVTTIFLLAFGLLIDPLIHGNRLPANYSLEMQQHNFLGVLLIGLGITEFLNLKKIINSSLWNLLLPLSLLTAGIIFFFHAQHDSNVPMLLLMTQHRIYGITLIIAGICKLLSFKSSSFAISWLICLLIFGFELLLYTEGSMLIQH